MIEYKKVTLVVGFDPEKDPQPAKMNWSKKGIEVRLLKVEDTEKPGKKEKAVCLIEARLLTAGASVKHPTKGIFKVKAIQAGPPGLLRIVFLDTENAEHIVMDKPGRMYEKAEEVAPILAEKPKRSRKKKAESSPEATKEAVDPHSNGEDKPALPPAPCV